MLVLVAALISGGVAVVGHGAVDSVLACIGNANGTKCAESRIASMIILLAAVSFLSRDVLQLAFCCCCCPCLDWLNGGVVIEHLSSDERFPNDCDLPRSKGTALGRTCRLRLAKEIGPLVTELGVT